MSERVLIYTQAYNAEHTLQRAVNSILAQDFCGLEPEYVLIDNGSTDGTSELVDSYSRRYSWITPVHLAMNISPVSALIAAALRGRQWNGYYVHLDADDEYLPDFFRATYRFLKEEDLDIAACQIARVDDSSGKDLSIRQLPGNQVWERTQYAEGYIVYRRFFMERWAKIYRLPLVWNLFQQVNQGLRNSQRDYQDTLDLVARANRIGVLSQTLYRYYISPQQYSGSFRPGYIQTLPEQIGSLRRWLAQFGPVSRLNEDYLAAIYLGWCENALEQLRAAKDLTNAEKLAHIQFLLSLPETNAVMGRSDCDPRFHSLAERDAFWTRIQEMVVRLGGDPLPLNNKTNEGG